MRLMFRSGPATAYGHRSSTSPDPPAPSTPVTRGVLCVARRVGATQARPCRRPRAPPPCQRGYCGSSTFACNSPVTISEFELASLELQRFWALLKVHAIELHAKFLVCVSIVTHGLRSFVQGIPRMLRIRIVRGQVGGTPCSAGGPTGFGLLSVVEGVSSRWTVQNSPCLACVLCERYKILPAYAFWAKTAVFSRAGRVLYRDGCVVVVVGRVLYRQGCATVVVGRVLYRDGCVAVLVGRVFSLSIRS